MFLLINNHEDQNLTRNQSERFYAHVKKLNNSIMNTIWSSKPDFSNTKVWYCKRFMKGLKGILVVVNNILIKQDCKSALCTTVYYIQI